LLASPAPGASSGGPAGARTGSAAGQAGVGASTTAPRGVTRSIVTAPPASTAASLPRSASGQVVVPDTVLPDAADLPQVGLRRTSDTGNRVPAGALSAADTCGTAPSGRPAAAGSRAVALEHRTAATSTSWLLGGTVRVFRADGASRNVAAADRLACTDAVTVTGADEAAIGHGTADAQGRTHWYGLVRVGRTISEVRLVVPKGGAAGRADVVRIVRLAGGRLVASGFAAAAGADPGLR
jgi:hypothetical protein